VSILKSIIFVINEFFSGEKTPTHIYASVPGDFSFSLSAQSTGEKKENFCQG
jgi:hypothetical protein